MVTMNVHQVPKALYDSMPVEEVEYDESVWKVLDLPGISIALFPERTPVPDPDMADADALLGGRYKNV